MAARVRTQRQIAQSAIPKGMRDRGFAGSAPHYFMDLPEAWLVVTLNHGRGFAAPGASSFTGDVWTSSKAILRVRGIDPTEKPRRAESHSEMRIGSLMRPPYDRWWTTADNMTDDELAATVDSFIRAVDEALPRMQEMASDAVLLRQLEEIVAERPFGFWTRLLRDLSKGMTTVPEQAS